MFKLPRVSIIVPAYNAGKEILSAIASTEACGLSSDSYEIIVASDDGCDYRHLVNSSARLVFSEVGPIGTGPGPARNRALGLARGQFVAFLDADDTWEPEYLAQLVPMAETHGLAFGRTSVLKAGSELLRLPRRAHLTFADMAESGASFHPVIRRECAGSFRDLPSQDIFHAVEVLAACGGRAPVSETAYQLRLRPSSVTQAAGFSGRLAPVYSAYAADIRGGKSRVPPHLIQPAASVFEAKLELNRAYESASKKMAFYEFVASRMPSDDVADRSG